MTTTGTWLDSFPDEPPAPPAQRKPKAPSTGTWLDSFPDDGAQLKAKHTTWDPRDFARSQAKQNAVRQASFSDDETSEDASNPQAQQATGNVIAKGALGAADALGMGLADEARGVGAAAVEPWRALFTGHGLGDPVAAYQRARDTQREATSIAQEQNPGAYGTGELVGTLGPALLPGGAAASAGRGSAGVGRAAFKGAAAGAGFGAAGGFGHGEGAADSLKQGSVSALLGAALGGAGRAASAGLPKIAPAALTKPRSLPSVNVGGGARKAGALALDAAAAAAKKAPAGAGAAIGGSLGGPAGAGVGALVGDKVAGGAGEAVAGKLSGAAERLRGGGGERSGPTENAANRDLQAYLREIMPDPWGVAPDDANVGGTGVTRELQALKYRMGASADAPPPPAAPRGILGAVDDALSAKPIPEDEINSFGGADEWESFARGTPATPASRPELDKAAEVLRTGTRADRQRTPRPGPAPSDIADKTRALDLREYRAQAEHPEARPPTDAAAFVAEHPEAFPPAVVDAPAALRAEAIDRLAADKLPDLGQRARAEAGNAIRAGEARSTAPKTGEQIKARVRKLLLQEPALAGDPETVARRLKITPRVARREINNALLGF